MPLPDDERSRELFEGGHRELERRYEPDLGLVRQDSTAGTWHSPRDSLWYALCLLLTETDSTAEAERIIRQVLTMQERREGDSHLGNFHWLYEDEAVGDLNAVEFVLECLTHILERALDKLSDQVRGEVFDAMRLGFDEVGRLDVHWTYTNIYLLDVHNSILGGRLLGDAAIAQRGVRRLRDWAKQTKADGAPYEFNSATYSAVQINALAAIVQFTDDDDARATAWEMEEFLWRHVAGHFHPPTLQLAGPHSRAYRRDVTGAPDFLKVLLYKLLGEPRLLATTPYYSGPGREGNVLVALTDYHCPDDALDMFRHAGTREVRECASRKQDQHITTFLTPQFALGTMSRPYGVGDPPEPWPGHDSCILYYAKDREPRYGVLYCRYLVNDRRVGQFAYEADNLAVDLWEEGTFRTAQQAGDAVVAYGLMPRGQRPVTSLRLDVRLLGVDEGSHIIVGDRTFDGSDEMSVEPGEALGIADGAVYIGVRPLEPTRLGHEPPIVLRRDGQETVLSIHNYRGPAKAFWEYRSLAGPFFKGNVRNGFILRVAASTDYPSFVEFLSSFRQAFLRDDVQGGLRRIALGVGPEALILEYDLRQTWP